MSASPAKITPPRLPRVYPRKRLFHLLDESSERQIIWISAPAGAGKTTLAASWLLARNLPCIWYQMDEGDGDIATFFYYLGLAAKKAAPRHRKPLPLFTPEYLLGISTFARRYFENLFSRLKTPCTVVFDNYQEVSSDSPFHEVIREGVSVVPPGVNVIFISRGAPPAAMAPLKAGRRLALLGWEEIRLTLDETAGIAALQSKEGVGAESIRRMHEMAQGWAAGVILMAESMPADDDALSLPGKSDLAEVFDYFAAEILAKTTPEVREFLLKSSLLPTMTAKMARRLTGLERSEQILSHLVRNHYFTQKHAHSEPVYQYHPLFRDFLHVHLRDAFSETELSGLRRQAAAILADSGEIEDAADLLREAGTWEEFVPLVLSRAQSLMLQGRIQTLAQWLRTIPAEIVENNSWLLYWQGACSLPFNPAESQHFFERAFELFRKEDNVAGQYLAWAGIADSIYYAWSDCTPLDRWLPELDELLQRHPVFPSVETEVLVSNSVFGALLFRNPVHDRLAFWEKRLDRLIHTITGSRLRILMGGNLVYYYILLGNFAKAARLIDALQAPHYVRDLTPLALLVWNSMKALYSWHAGDFEGCRKIVAEGLKIAETVGFHLHDVTFLSLGVSGALSAGELSAGAALLGRIKSLMNPERQGDVCFYHHLAGWEAALREDIPRALDHVRLSLSLTEKTEMLFPQALNHAALAQLLTTLGDYPEASRSIETARRIGHDVGSSAIETMCLMAEARLALDRNDETSGLAALREGFALGKKMGLVNHSWWLPQVMAQLCAKALEAGIEVEYVQQLVRKRDLIPPAAQMTLENWPWPLKIYTLGRFALVKDGEPVSFSGKVQQKPLALLKALIALGGREVSEEHLADLLWPDAEGAAARTAFNTTLHRLRRLLGNDRAVLMGNGNITLNPRLCWADAWAFEMNTGGVDALLKEKGADKNPANLTRTAEKALALYQGNFLAGDAIQPWAISRRERLRSRFLHLIGMLGQSLEGAGKWRKAAECYRKGLETDDLAEEFYQRLMVCHQHLGNRAEALKVYERCRTTLAALLGVAPSAKTRAIYKAIADQQ